MSDSLPSRNDGVPPGPFVRPLVYAPPDPEQEFVWRLVAITPRTPVTMALVAANVLVFLAFVIRGGHLLWPTFDSLFRWGGNFGPSTISGEWWRLITCMFLHGGFLHLALNMWALYDAGRFVERLFGNVGFLLLYFVSGIGGSLATIYWHWNEPRVSVGASGAIFGIVGGLIGYLVRQRHSLPITLTKRLRGSLGSFLVFNLAFGVSVPVIDMAAHLGGLVAGLLSAMILAQPITLEGARRRWLTNLALLLLAPPLLTGAAVFLSLSVPAVRAEPKVVPPVALDKWKRSHQRIIARYNMAAARNGRGDLSSEQFAKYIETEILPEWRELQATLDQIGTLPPAAVPQVERLRRYAAQRAKGWELLVEGLRGDDLEKRERARQLQDEADQLLDPRPQRKDT